MNTLVLVLLVNMASGVQVEIPIASSLSVAACDVAQRNVWLQESPVVYRDEIGDVELIDAACVAGPASVKLTAWN